MIQDVIRRYSKTYTLEEPGEGAYSEEDGMWEEGEATEREIECALLPLTTDDLKYDEAGMYTLDDRRAYALEPLPINGKLKASDRTFVIHEGKVYEDFGVYIYMLRAGDDV